MMIYFQKNIDWYGMLLISVEKQVVEGATSKW